MSFLHFVVIFGWQFVGIYLFASGFLLSKTVHPNATCNTGINECIPPLQARFKRICIVLIDALRFDFAKFDAFPLMKPIPRFLNRLPIFHRLLNEHPKQAALFRFIADAPTTTLQRVKSLTTGSLPTFIDIGENFNSRALSEDNIIAQLYAANRSVVVLGDEIWGQLFPDLFKRHFLFPSLDVADFHSVDYGIISNIFNEMNKSDWDVIICHFLGVDHIGHRVGPDHPAMATKVSPHIIYTYI